MEVGDKIAVPIVWQGAPSHMGTQQKWLLLHTMSLAQSTATAPIQDKGNITKHVVDFKQQQHVPLHQQHYQEPLTQKQITLHQTSAAQLT